MRLLANNDVYMQDYESFQGLIVSSTQSSVHDAVQVLVCLPGVN